MVTIRPERSEDAAAVRRVNELAFGQPAEAELVEALHRREEPMIALVAEEAGQVVGHIMFSPVTVYPAEGSAWSAIGLAPLAVLPTYQGQGIGGQLVRAGLDACRRAGHEVVVVLGHPTYYPRFGFQVSAPLGIHWQGEAPAEAFMVLELYPGALTGRQGVVEFLPEFDGV